LRLGAPWDQSNLDQRNNCPGINVFTLTVNIMASTCNRFYGNAFALHGQTIPSIEQIQSIYGGCDVLFDDEDSFDHVLNTGSSESSSEVSNNDSDLYDWSFGRDVDADEEDDGLITPNEQVEEVIIGDEYASFCDDQSHATLSVCFAIASDVLGSTMSSLTSSTPGELLMNVRQVLEHTTAAHGACHNILTMKDYSTAEENQFLQYLQDSIDSLEKAIAANDVDEVVSSLNAVHHNFTMCAASPAFCG
jgi:hypothetical protein